MNGGRAAALRTFAFGDVDAMIWGAGLVADTGDAGFLSVAAGSDAVLDKLSLSTDASDGTWTLAGNGLELVLEPTSAAAELPDGGGYDELCHAHGRLQVAGSEREVDALGCRGSRMTSELGRLGSLRAVLGWLSPDEGFAVVALRPRKSRGHEGEIITATWFETERAVAVADPRLSTTYGADGRPRRAGLELWLTDEETEEQEYPQRAAGEATGAAAVGQWADRPLEAQLFRFHSRGKDGAGVYLLLGDQ